MHEILRSLSVTIDKSLPPDLPASLLTVILGCSLTVIILAAGISLLRQRELAARLKKKRLQFTALQKEHAGLLEKTNEHRIQETKLVTLLKNERKHASEKLRLLEEARTELSLQFENLATKILDEKSIKFSELNREKLDAILTPFNKQIDSLKHEINEMYRNDSRERISLKNEIVQLRDLNLQVTREANNLTKALTSDTKIQGNWGELVLERILERSGLKKGREYDIQGGFRDENNKLFKPDVVIHLPDGKDIIIDSKVSLLSWERFINCESKEDRKIHLKQLRTSILDHVKGLGNKNYSGLNGIYSLDFVLMFMPIEAAFRSVCEENDSLLMEALSQNVIIVTPTTLLATLRTIENIWQFDQQSKNSLEIARRAGLMYDKFRGFIEDIEKIGKQLTVCQANYDGALLKLSQGRGNLIAQAEQLRDLGVQVKKELPRTVTEKADSL